MCTFSISRRPMVLRSRTIVLLKGSGRNSAASRSSKHGANLFLIMPCVHVHLESLKKFKIHFSLVSHAFALSEIASSGASPAKRPPRGAQDETEEYQLITSIGARMAFAIVHVRSCTRNVNASAADSCGIRDVSPSKMRSCSAHVGNLIMTPAPDVKLTMLRMRSADRYR